MSEIIKKTIHLRSKGQIIVLMALVLVGLVAAVGLAVDVTMVYISKQSLQRAIDAAAVAASRKLPDQNLAEQTAYEMMRLHGYDFDPSTHPLSFSYEAAPQKIIAITGDVDEDLFLLPIINWNSTTIDATGEAESAPIDIYLVLDLSQSMVYDTPTYGLGCSTWRCVAEKCNNGRFCRPLDTKIKPAAKYFVDLMSAGYDRIGLVTYHRYGVIVQHLTYDFNLIKTAIDNLDAFEPDLASTNIGDGIMNAHADIATYGRMDSIWAMVLLTDGRANVYRNCTGCPPNCGGTGCGVQEGPHGGYWPEHWAIVNAQDTWDRHETVIYTIAYGDIFLADPSYKDLMIDIADITDNGSLDGSTDETKGNFWQAPDVAELRTALEEIAERIYTRLLR